MTGTVHDGAGVQIEGIGLHPFGRHPQRTLADLGAAAVSEALRDAGIDGRSVTATFCASAYGGVASGHRVLGQLGLTGGPIIDVEAGCASGAAALALAATAIRSGEHDRVLVVGVDKMPRGMIRSSYFPPWREAAGLAAAPPYFALRAQRLLFDTGLTKADLAAVVVKNRAYGVHNHAAMRREAVTAEAVLDSRLVCEPLHLWMLCAPNDGAAAVVLQRSRPSARRVVRLAAVALRSHRPGDVLDESTPLAGLDDGPIDGSPSATTAAARDAYEQAGVGPENLDVVECQDTDAARELLAYEELGLCEPTEQGRLLAERAAHPTGSLPVNTSGGLLSKGEPLGASALGQVVELVLQLRGDAGARQVPGASIALAQTVGRGANASVTILRTDSLPSSGSGAAATALGTAP